MHTNIRISLNHHIALRATGCETSHLALYKTNILSKVNIIQIITPNYIHIKTRFKVAKIINKFMIEIYFF